MKLAIIIFVLSAFLFFTKVQVVRFSDYDKWVIIKGISLITMIISFISIIVMW